MRQEAARSITPASGSLFLSLAQTHGRDVADSKHLGRQAYEGWPRLIRGSSPAGSQLHSKPVGRVGSDQMWEIEKLRGPPRCFDITTTTVALDFGICSLASLVQSIGVSS